MTISDEIYQLKEFSRDTIRVLLSVDMERTAVTEAQQKLILREDGDFPLCFVKSCGRGRVFYSALGHQHELFWNPVVLEHLLDGIQFALGDLAADTTPSNVEPLFMSDPQLELMRECGGVSLFNRGRTVWRVTNDRTLDKSYVHPLALVDGTLLTWLRPPDHVWHRGLWFSWKFINGVNYWEEVDGMGQTRVTAFRSDLGEDFSARFELELEYFPPDKPPVMKEERILTMSPPDGEGWYSIDWLATFTALGEDLLLDRTPPPEEPGGQSWGGYSGMSVRLARQTADWRIMDSEGRTGMECHRQPARWIGCEFIQTSAGREAGICILDHPANARHPAPSFIVLRADIPFVYFSPAPLFNEPLALPAGESLTLGYRILVYPGRKSVEQLDAAWQEFAAEERR